MADHEIKRVKDVGFVVVNGAQRPLQDGGLQPARVGEAFGQLPSAPLESSPARRGALHADVTQDGAVTGQVSPVGQAETEAGSSKRNTELSLIPSPGDDFFHPTNTSLEHMLFLGDRLPVVQESVPQVTGIAFFGSRISGGERKEQENPSDLDTVVFYDGTEFETDELALIGSDGSFNFDAVIEEAEQRRVSKEARVSVTGAIKQTFHSLMQERGLPVDRDEETGQNATVVVIDISKKGTDRAFDVFKQYVNHNPDMPAVKAHPINHITFPLVSRFLPSVGEGVVQNREYILDQFEELERQGLGGERYFKGLMDCLRVIGHIPSDAEDTLPRTIAEAREYYSRTQEEPGNEFGNVTLEIVPPFTDPSERTFPGFEFKDLSETNTHGIESGVRSTRAEDAPIVFEVLDFRDYANIAEPEIQLWDEGSIQQEFQELVEKIEGKLGYPHFTRQRVSQIFVTKDELQPQDEKRRQANLVYYGEEAGGCGDCIRHSDGSSTIRIGHVGDERIEDKEHIMTDMLHERAHTLGELLKNSVSEELKGYALVSLGMKIHNQADSYPEVFEMAASSTVHGKSLDQLKQLLDAGITEEEILAHLTGRPFGDAMPDDYLKHLSTKGNVDELRKTTEVHDRKVSEQLARTENENFVSELFQGSQDFFKAMGRDILDIHSQTFSTIIADAERAFAGITDDSEDPEFTATVNSFIDEEIVDDALSLIDDLTNPNSKIIILRDKENQKTVGFTCYLPMDDPTKVRVGYTAILEEFRGQGGWSVMMQNLDEGIAADGGYTTMVRTVRLEIAEMIRHRYEAGIVNERELFDHRVGEQREFTIDLAQLPDNSGSLSGDAMPDDYLRVINAKEVSSKKVIDVVPLRERYKRRGSLGIYGGYGEVPESEWIPPAHIKTIYHYTSGHNWRAMQRDGAIKPETSPQSWAMLAKELRDIPEEDPELDAFWQRHHLVGGVDARGFDQWKDAGEHDRLLEYTSKGTGQVVLLSFPASAVRGAYLLDHSLNSTRYRNELLGFDPYKAGSNITEEVRARAVELEGRYYRSVVKSHLYDGTFAVPEIWIPHPIDLSVVTVEKEGRIEDFK